MQSRALESRFLLQFSESSIKEVLTGVIQEPTGQRLRTPVWRDTPLDEESAKALLTTTHRSRERE